MAKENLESFVHENIFLIKNHDWNPSFYGILKHGLKILWKIIYFTPATPQDPKWISY